MTRVVYPGLPDHPDHELLKRLGNPAYGFGGILTLDLGDSRKANTFMEILQNKDRFGFMNIRRQRAETEKLLRSRIGLTSSAMTVDSPVGGLSGGEKQGVAFVRALYFDADLIILDEQTMGLSIKETERVLDFVKGLRGQGKSAIFIDHNIFHVYDAATRFVILDRGRIVAQFGKAEISHKDLIATMVELHNKGQTR